MPKNQLFKINPDAIIMNSLLNSFGLSGLTDTRFFTRKNMLENSTIKIIENMIPTLISYYLPCKAKIYLIALNEKKCITILRQFLKFFHYKCIGIEKSIDGTKTMTYRLMLNDTDQLSPTKAEESRKYVLSFDI